ncbi:MAG: DUF1800 family protein [Pseudomonadota bacterium]
MVRSSAVILTSLWAGLSAVFGFASAQDISDRDAARFLMQASFGPNRESIADLQARGYVGWLQHQMDLPYVSVSDRIDASREVRQRGRVVELIDLFSEQAFYGEDQLRQRIRFALSQIVVASLSDSVTRGEVPAFLDYVDALGEEAFGNYCTLVRRVTFQPTMALYLTYYKNQKADEQRGVAPDENYAREVMQLFTIGLEELEIDGTPTGVPTYDQDDVSGLAAVFTGLALPGENFDKSNKTVRPFRGELVGFPAFHEASEKRFLGKTIGPGNDAVASVNEALDHLLMHPNVAPFISKQLIQRLTMSNPSPQYIERVARAFNEGLYKTSAGATFGVGERCDMSATTAAILLDPEARRRPGDGDEIAGKVREPIIRAIHTIRSVSDGHQLSVEGPIPQLGQFHKATDVWGRQLPFSSPTVFNFYRPTYVRPGSEAEAEGIIAPETQILTASHFAATTTWVNGCVIRMRCWTEERLPPNLTQYYAVATRPSKLVDMLDLYLTAGTLHPETRKRISSALWTIDVPPGAQREEALTKRLSLAFSMVITSPEFMVQR